MNKNNSMQKPVQINYGASDKDIIIASLGTNDVTYVPIKPKFRYVNYVKAVKKLQKIFK